MGSPFQYNQQAYGQPDFSQGGMSFGGGAGNGQGMYANPLGGAKPLASATPDTMSIQPYGQQPNQSFSQQAPDLGGKALPPLAAPSPERPIGFPTAGANSPEPYANFRGVSPYSPMRMY